MYGLDKLMIGNAFRRNMDERFSRVMYQRDFRLTDNPYKMNGLEQIPDEEVKKEEKDPNEDSDDPAIVKKREKERKLREKQLKKEEKLREKQLKEEEKQKIGRAHV